MELRKEKEIEHYDKQAKEWLENASEDKWQSDFEGFQPKFLSSFVFCYQWLKENCKNKKILDYGCGNGLHSVFLAKLGKGLIGIDLSEPSLKIAKERAEKEGLEDKTEFMTMDCEKMDFPDNYFDIIFDGGTFSSIDLNGAYPELARVLKPAGFLIGIETFGHNPFTNLKRRLNKITGKRTEWAARHIFQIKDLEKAERYFNKIEVRHFHLFSWIFFPFLNWPGARFFLKLFDFFDKFLLKIHFLRKYAFKVVFVFSQPKK